MKKTPLTGLLSIMTITGFAEAKALRDTLLPRPQQCEVTQESFTISDQTKIVVVSDGAAKGEYAGTQLAKLLKEQYGLNLEIVPKRQEESFSLVLGNQSASKAGSLYLEPVKRKEGGYVLRVGEGSATIRANTAQGLFHGATTLRQLVATKKVKGCKISDYPRYEMRCFMIDAGRAHLLPSDERSFTLLDSIYSEWFSAMTCNYIHLGMDEPLLPRAKRAKYSGELLRRLLETAKQHNQEPKLIVWADAPETPEQYKGDVIRALWSNGNRDLEGGQTKDLKHHKIDVLLKPGCKEKVLMGAGSSSGGRPGSKCYDQGAFRNLAEWPMLGNDKENFIGIIACQRHGNQLDQWLPDFLVAADVSWNPPAEVPEFTSQIKGVESRLARFKDEVSPDESETIPLAWQGV